MKPLHALLLTLVVTFAGLLPVVGRGHVFFAHGNELELGLPLAEQELPANRRLSDQSAAFAPELALHLAEDRGSWTALWNPHVQLGRPAHHTGGMSKAFWPTHVLAWFHSDALVVMSALVCLTLLLSAAFAFGMGLELGVRPLGSAALGVGFALSPFAAYWSSFPIFLNTPCWTMGLLFCAARFLRTGGAWSGLGVVLCAHTLLVGSYPQAVIWSLYLALPLMLAWSLRSSWGRRGALVGLGVLGVLSTMPWLADLLLAAQRSARLETDPEFFTQVLPRPESLSEWAAMACSWVDGSLRGNPLRDARPASFTWSAAWTPLFACAALWALSRRMPAQTWIVLSYTVLIFLATFVPAVYLLGWEHMGWSLSRFVPLGALLVPGFLLAALGMQRAQGEGAARWLVMLPLLLVLMDASLNGFRIEALAVSIAGILIAWWCARDGNQRVFLAAAALGGLWYCGLHFLHRAPTDVARDSGLVEAVREATGDGSRFAWVAKDPPRLLPPNQEIWLGLRSVHSYDSLSSRAYQDWCEKVSTEAARNYGRKFDHIEGVAGLGSAAFQSARVGLVLSREDLRVLGWRLLSSYGAVGLWKPTELAPFARVEAQPGASVRAKLLTPGRVELSLEGADGDALVVLSQQFHPQWTARFEGLELATVAHEGLWQAVRVPAGVRSISLEFRPWVRWMWVPQLLLALAAAWLLLRSWRSSRSGLLGQPGTPGIVEGQR